MENTKLTSQQLRGFAAVWIGITLLIGLATFVAIYVGTGSIDGERTTQALSGNAGNVGNVEDSIGNDSDPAVAIAPDANTVDDNAAVDNTNTTDDVVSGDEGDSGTANVAAGDANNAPALQTEEPTDAAPPPAAPTETPVPTFEPTAPAIQSREFDLGIQVVINPDPNIMGGYLDAAANQLNLNWVKLQIRWEFVEPEEGVFDWVYLDSFFALTPEKDLKVMASIVTAPEWAREPGADLTKHGPPADNQRFANFVAMVLTRYPGRIHAVEVWNETNIDREWASPRGIIAADYVAMLEVVANTVRFVDPNIIIISGAPSPTGINAAFAIDDLIYVDQLIAAGVLEIADCFGVHHNGYNIGPNVPFDQVPNDPTATFRGPFDNPNHSWSFYTTLNTYANKIQAAGSDVPLCITEFGWATTEDLQGFPPGFEFANDNTLIEQGQFIVEAINLMDEWDFVWLAFIWNLNFAPEAGFEATNDNVPYSLIRPGYTQSAAWLPVSEMNFRERN